MALGTFERFLTQELRRYASPGAVVYDIGASFGYHALSLATMVGERGTVVAFEPADADRRVLERNVAMNSFANIEVRREAVGASSGTARFATFDYSLVNHLATGADPEDARVTAVPLVSLDDFVYEQGNAPPSLVKFSLVQGEDDVIVGARRLIEEARPVVIAESGFGCPLARIEEVVTPLGYRIRRLVKSPYSEWRSKFLLLPPHMVPHRG